MLASAVWARHVALVAVGDVEMLGEFFLAVLAEENVLRHGRFSGEMILLFRVQKLEGRPLNKTEQMQILRLRLPHGRYLVRGAPSRSAQDDTALECSGVQLAEFGDAPSSQVPKAGRPSAGADGLRCLRAKV